MVDKSSFKRMQDVAQMYDGMTYEQFHAWNAQCINTLSKNELAMLKALCTRLQNGTLALMDLEDCCVFKSDCFYFDTEKRLCIVTPR